MPKPTHKPFLLKLHPKHINDLLPKFLRDEATGGKLILVATILALVAVNSPLRSLYDTFWLHQLSVGLGSWQLSLDLRHWINEGLMAIFFLVVGLEIKRELTHGEFRDIRKIGLPVAAAIGGMIVPALFYLMFNHQPGTIQGWGIPIATDIAFAVAVLTLLGPRIPTSLKLFLLTLAIADDIGAILVIALFYAEIINFWFLGASVSIIGATWILRKYLAHKLALFLVIGTVLWFTTHLSGIHASIVGAVLGLLAPIGRRSAQVSIAHRLEDFFLPVSTFVVVPLFAFANAGVVFAASTFRGADSVPVISGIIAGLVLGKVLGIAGATWLMVKYSGAKLPAGTNWQHIVGVGLVAGIGFTVSIFMTELAFPRDELLSQAAKVGVFIASLMSAVIGSTVLRGIKQIPQSDTK